MPRFCTKCGAPMQQDALFCTSCGAKAKVTGDTGISYQSPENTTGFSHQPEKKKKPLWLLITVPIVVLALVSTALVFGIYRLLDSSGYLDERALRNASRQWQNQEDFRDEKEEIMESVAKLATALKNQDIPATLDCFYPDSRDEMEAIFVENREKMPVLAQILETAEISYLSEQTGYYEELRMARVCAGTPSEENPSQGVASLTLVKTEEEGWVVEKLQ